MIQRLLITNYALIEELEVDFSEKLTIITGETGAGKSILLGALGLIMGHRADTKVFYNSDKKCIVEGFFDISRYGLKGFFDLYDIDYDYEIVIRRELTPAGKSRAFVNDTPVNLKILQQLSAAIIDLHQQFDTLDIHNVSFQMRMIDALAGNTSLLADYQAEFKQYQTGKRQLAQLIQQNQNATTEMDFLNFQLNEFKEASLEKGEQASLEEEMSRLSNAEGIKTTLSQAFQQLSENEQSTIGQLESIALAIGQIKNFHPDLESVYERYQGAILELQDLTQEFESIAEQTEYDGQRISEIELRLDQIYKLQNKHRVKSIEELLAIQYRLEDQLNAFGDLSNEIEYLQSEMTRQEKSLHKKAKILQKARHAVVEDFEINVQQLLAQLAMEYARLKVEIKALDELNATGLDDVNFLFASNKGSRFLPLKDVASGGELSRLTLCTKSLVADAIPLPTLIFDEIDTGISGDVALKMGNILQDLANRHQVVTITHSPQIAVKADMHYFVYKKVLEDRTATKVKLLTPDERIRAVATMLSGNPPSASAIENAKELLAQ
ncbi:MAG: DNA repair protein RecN [Bacteroidota bacterium]